MGVLILVQFSLFAQENDKTESPYFFVKSENSETEQMPLISTDVKVEIIGVIAEVHIQQVYKNTGKNTIEAIYVFPSSTKAAIHKMDMQIGERILEARIYEKNKAKKIYNDAKKEGKTTSLLEQERPNVFKMSVANIMPGDTIITNLYYTELLVPEEGIYEFVYPTVVGPRYSNPENENAVSEDFVNNPYTQEGEKPLYTFDIEINIDAGMPLNGANCKTHNFDINFINKNKAVCKLEKSDKFEGNRDVIFNYSLIGNNINSGLLMFEGKDENFFLLMMQPPKRKEIRQTPPKEYIFIIDISGSMEGFPIDVSKKLISDLLNNLNNKDKFNIILFAGTSFIMSKKSLQVNEANIQKAMDVIKDQNGSGGTELSSAIKKGMELKSDEQMSRTYVVITDGYISQEAETFELIRDNPSQSNFFVFGIGRSVNRFLIEGIAKVGNGEPFIVTNKSEATEKANLFRKYIESPVLTNIKVEFEGFKAYDIIPNSYADVFADRPILVYGKWKGNPKGKIKVSGFTGKDTYLQEFDIEKTSNTNSNEALKYLWARKKIELLDDYASFTSSNNSKEEVTELGLKYSLLTKYTSFVAVDSVIRNTGNSETVNQPLPLPEGVSNNAVANNYRVSEIINIVEDDFEFDLPEEDADLDYVDADYDESEEYVVEDDEVFLIVEKMPQFPGGEIDLKAFISQNVQYPQLARENDIQGKVYIRFQVMKDGSIGEVQVIRGVDKLLDDEAIRVIKLLPKFKPGMQRGKAVAVWYTVPVNFVLK